MTFAKYAESYQRRTSKSSAKRSNVAPPIGAALVKKYKGTVVIVGPNSVKRSSYDFNQHKDDIVATLNELEKAVTDAGLMPVLHQHTGTCVETRDETYAVLESVDTRVMKFGPDIGQLQKGRSDPVQDYDGGSKYLGYCPLGHGKVDIPAILSMMNGRKTAALVMVELDSPPPQPSKTRKSRRLTCSSRLWRSELCDRLSRNCKLVQNRLRIMHT